MASVEAEAPVEVELVDVWPVDGSGVVLLARVDEPESVLVLGSTSPPGRP